MTVRKLFILDGINQYHISEWKRNSKEIATQKCKYKFTMYEINSSFGIKYP